MKTVSGDGDYVERVVSVNIVPLNDSPTIHLPPNDTLTLVANTRMELDSDLLSATDPDDAAPSLEFGVYPSDDDNGDGADDAGDCGYFELVTSGGVRAKITRFNQRDVQSGQ